MKLYLVQHGEARPKEEDPERHLTEKGLSDTEKMAAFIMPMGLPVDAVWQSGKTRAEETANILGSVVVSESGIVQRDGLEPNDDVAPVAQAIREMTDGLMIVGHMPFVSKLASTLLAGDEDAGVVTFRNSGVVCLERGDEGRYSLCWAVTPDLAP